MNMNNLLAPSTKAKIGAGFIALATMFGFGGCTQPTGGDDGIIDPYHIGRHGGIEVRVVPGVNRAYGEEVLNQLREVPTDQITANAPGITVIEITGPAGVGFNIESVNNGRVRGHISSSGHIMEFLIDAANLITW